MTYYLVLLLLSLAEFIIVLFKRNTNNKNSHRCQMLFFDVDITPEFNHEINMFFKKIIFRERRKARE